MFALLVPADLDVELVEMKLVDGEDTLEPVPADTVVSLNRISKLR